jgi:hypothetical protein
MTALIKSASENGLASTLTAAAIIGLIGWLWRLRQNRRDSQAILNFLTESTIKTPHTFRSTEAISSKTKITESRIESLCIKHPKIQRNEKEKQSWRLVD